MFGGFIRLYTDLSLCNYVQQTSVYFRILSTLVESDNLAASRLFSENVTGSIRSTKEQESIDLRGHLERSRETRPRNCLAMDSLEIVEQYLHTVVLGSS